LITLTGLDPEDYRIVDGSGVSHYNLISPELILGVLSYIYYNEPGLFDIFYKSLAIAGVDGTLEKRMIDTKSENNVRAKTGTISGVSCLSGYVRAANGHNLAFSIMIQNFATKARVAKRFEDQICNILAEYK
ncbi:MAG: D-alanyl-D-alanine carboxypeptidase, partial [Ignavibacteriaceae bacterium]